MRRWEPLEDFFAQAVELALESPAALIDRETESAFW